MPTAQSFELPKPSNWQDFENIVRDAFAQTWMSTDLSKNGRPGQSQNGVDIFGPDNIGRPVGIQCKCYKEALKIEDISAEVEKAEKFKGKISTLYVATKGDHDAMLQQKVRALSDKRVAQGRFAVAVLFWDEIVSGLLLNPAVCRAHYPQINLDTPAEVNRERLIAALELGYYGAELWEYIVLVFGEFGWVAHTDPDEVLVNLRILEVRTQQLLSPKDAEPILHSLKEVRIGCQAPKTSESDWHPVEIHAKRVQTRLRGASSVLCLAESNMLDLSVHLGVIYHRSDDLPGANACDAVKAKVKSVLPESSEPEISSKFASAESIRSGYNWAAQIFSLVNHELRYRR